jgi:hypothetical protein
LVVYVVTLAPSVTFWDAGELIAASHILGVPHPPGTPLFVLLSNVWAKLVPFGELAWRTNLMAAVFSAAGAALWFLIVARALVAEAPAIRFGAAAAGAGLSAVAFTVWQNSNETEVYMVATFTIAAVAWLAVRWREVRGTPRAAHLLLIIIYLEAVSLGNHLLALLVGPALIAFLVHVLRTEPAADDKERGTEWAQLGVVAAAWVLMVGTGLGLTALSAVGALAFLAAAGFAATRRSLTFAAAGLVVAVVGISTYAFLYVSANLGPMINEADPSTVDALLSVIRREQYPPRTPLDDPTFPSGVGNPGRSIGLIALQIANYIQYFDWQWARSLAFETAAGLTPRLPFTVLFTGLGIAGLRELKRADRSIFWLLMVLWLVTGLGLLAYMNFKPGFAIGYDRYPNPGQHEVRERDYFFVVSFLCWGLFAGIGLGALVKHLAARVGRYALAAYSVVLLPFVLNVSVASRRGADAQLPRDFAYNLLQSVEPYGILFVYGDNDTFPLWYLQEVEAVRQDVAVVNLSLAGTHWYLRQLRDNPVRPFDPAGAPARYGALAPPTPPPPPLQLTDAEIASLQSSALAAPLDFAAGPIRRHLPAGTPLYVKDQAILLLVRQNWNTRPIVWSVTAGRENWLRLEPHLLQQGLGVRLQPDTTGLGALPIGAVATPVDVERTRWLADTVYRYAGLLDGKRLRLEPTARGVARNLSVPYVSLVYAYEVLRQRALLTDAVRRWVALSPTAAAEEYLQFIESPAADSLFEP